MGKSCESCDGIGSVAAAFRIGWMVTPNLAVLYDGSGFAGPVGELSSTSSMVLSGAAQYWVAPRAWLKAGIGVARLEVTEGVFGQQERSDRGLGVVAAGGYQVATFGRFVLELEARTTIGFYQERAVAGAGALLGLAWY